jgi:UTP--glucose-1-phosphate uridylyltransferase
MPQSHDILLRMKVKKAVFPVAGLGTRFLPVTKGSPKEMLPIVDTPLIQYAVNEAIAAGINALIFVTNGTKFSIKDYFDVDPILETALRESGKFELLETVQNILPKGISCSYVSQPSHLGLGAAVLCASELVGNEPFAVLLADDLIDSETKPCMQQMVEAFEKKQSSIIAIQKISHADTNKYGIVDIQPGDQRIVKLRGITEKPIPEDALSDFGVVGRYILTPDIFGILEKTAEGSGGEIQLTDAIAQLISAQSVYAFLFEGTRYDCGSKIGYLEGCVAFALKHPEFSDDFRKWLENFLKA